VKVLIVGAGIAGLSLALMLKQRGIECELCESVRQLRPLGVGINLLPHAVIELDQLGMLPMLAEQAIETSALHYYNRHGQKIWHEPRGLAAGYPVPQFSIHRGTLQMTLAQAVTDRLGADCLHTAAAFESLEQDGHGVTAHFFDRHSGARHSRRADVLIAADGIHSAVRRRLHAQSDPLRYSGRMLWRAITEAEPYLDGRTMFMAGHQDQKFVCYPISEPLRRKGRSLINWIAELRVPQAELPATDWNREVPASTFADHFDDWRWDWIDIPEIIRGAQAIYEFPLVDKDPLPRWTFGRVTLMGDAAHPMYPIGSNGAAQAILDARCLADRLQEVENADGAAIELALREYEAERLPATTGIVLRNRLNGPEQVMQMAHERAPQGFTDVHDIISSEELEAIAMRYKRLAGFDPTAIAAKVRS
jgi:2-polyprenyl-6-methoxyphenol hydroxylase-like FAD-dependent oxidoreductase